MIDCTTGTVLLDTLMLVLVYDSKGNIVAMSQVAEDLPPPPISVDIPRGKTGGYSIVWKNLQAVLRDSKSENYSRAKSE